MSICSSNSSKHELKFTILLYETLSFMSRTCSSSKHPSNPNPGMHIYARGSSNGKRVQSNMGAKKHAIVMPDASVDATLNALAAAGFGDAEQRCMTLSNVVKISRISKECEAALILEGIQEQMVILSEDPTIKIPISFDKGLQYAKAEVWSKDGRKLAARGHHSVSKVDVYKCSPPINEVIQFGFVPRFVEFLVRDDFPKLQFEVSWVLTNIASGTSEYTSVVIVHGAIQFSSNSLTYIKLHQMCSMEVLNADKIIVVVLDLKNSK